MKNILFLAVCVLSFTSLAQCENILLSGKVKDTLRPRNFYNLMVINKTSGRGVFGLPDGRFSVYVKGGDSVIFSVEGYNRISTIVRADSNCQFRKTWFIEESPQILDEVVVKPLKNTLSNQRRTFFVGNA